MSELVTTARTARERLSVGLNALQDPGLPESLQSAAEPIAQAMSMLLQIERTGALPLTKGGPSALDLVRQALAKLQSQTAESPALFQAMESVAGSLGLVYGLVQRASSAPPPAQSASPSNNPQRLVASPAVATAPKVAPAQPVPTSSQPAVTAGTRPQVTGGAAAASVQRAQPVQAEPAKVQQQAPRPSASASVSSAVAAAMQIPAGGNVTNSQTMVAGGVRPSTPGSTPPAAKVPSAPPAAAAPAPKANPVAMAATALAGAAAPPAQAAPTPAPAVVAAPSPTVGSGTPMQRVAAELGAHSVSNFYKGLSGNDVVDSGGIFIATYQVPSIGKPLLIRVSLPGGYEFEAKAIVRWTRESTSSGGDVPPGFGAQFTEISPEARQLVYRYARNREPLFHDDL